MLRNFVVIVFHLIIRHISKYLLAPKLFLSSVKNTKTMGELVGAITNLCKVLDCLLSISLKPDIFRLAKLNKLEPEQLQEILDATHKLCCYTSNDESCRNVPYECILNYFKRKEEGVVAYFLSTEATARQLLLCLGFVISGRIIESIIDKILMATPLAEELPSFMAKPTNDEQLETLANPDDPRALLNYVSFLSGKIKHNLRAVGNFREEKAKLFYKVHQATSSTQGSHLSVGDLLMTERPDLQQEFLLRCQHCVPLLQAYSRWHRKQHIFWEWMMTVLEEEYKTKPKPFSVAEITHLHEFLRRLKRDAQNIETAEVGNLLEDNNTLLAAQRFRLGESGEYLDTVIDYMNLQTNQIQVHNEELINLIKIKATKCITHQDLVNSILRTFCDVKNFKPEILNRLDVELPLLDSLNIE